MSKFTDCANINNLWQTVEDQYGRWGHLTEEAMDVVVATVLEERHPVEQRVRLMSMLAFTWMNESTFDLAPLPNVNHRPECVWNWDVGPFQLNLGWSLRMSWQGELATHDLPWKKVFGAALYGDDGETPYRFTGDIVAHSRCALRRLLAVRVTDSALSAYKDADESRVVRYTGPGAQPHRLEDWRKYGKLFQDFFLCYTS